MQYCHNCGAKLDDDARYCRVCGTPVATPASTSGAPATPPPTPTQSVRGFRMGRFWVAIVAVAIIVVVVLAAILIAFVPFQRVPFNQSNQVSAANVDVFKLDLNADLATVNLMVRDLPGNQRAETNISAVGRRGIFGSNNPLALSFNEETSGSTLMWRINVSRAGDWPFYSPLEVTCNVYVDSAARLDIEVTTSTGSIVLDADQEAVFQNLQLQSNMGSIQANLDSDVTLSGGFSLEASMGSVQLVWTNPEIAVNIPVNVKATTGSVDIYVIQNRPMQGNVTLNAEASAGSVTFVLNIQDDVGARISADASLGNVSVDQEGFSGDQVPIQSTYYPATHNFDVTLAASLGSVNIDANYESNLINT